MGKNVTDMGLEKKEKKELKKHAATIHCSNTLSLLQRKISNALLYHAYKELMLKEEHEITVKQLCRLIGYHGNNHAAIRDALRGLISTVIEWNLIDDETGVENWTASSIIASVSLEGPLCYYAYSPRMKQLLHSPSMFGKIDLVIQSKFRSSYGLALYENCIRYRGLPQTKWFEMTLFKKLMGVPQGKYDIFRDFKRRVLDKAIQEVNTYSDLIIAADYVKEGRKVIRVRFKLKERAKKTRLGSNKEVDAEISASFDVTLLEQLANGFGLTDEQIGSLAKTYDASFIQEKITMILASKPYQENRIENLTAYLFSAIKYNYQAKSKAIEEKEVKLQLQLDLELTSIKRHIEELRLHYKNYREKIIQEAIDGLPKDAKKTLLSDFHQFAGPTINTILKLQRNKYTKENVLDAPPIKALLRQYAIRELDLLPFISWEEFVLQQEEDKVIAWQKLKSFDPEHPLLRFQE